MTRSIPTGLRKCVLCIFFYHFYINFKIYNNSFMLPSISDEMHHCNCDLNWVCVLLRKLPPVNVIRVHQRDTKICICIQYKKLHTIHSALYSMQNGIVPMTIVDFSIFNIYHIPFDMTAALSFSFFFDRFFLSSFLKYKSEARKFVFIGWWLTRVPERNHIEAIDWKCTCCK